jgi:hypothetical protein
LKLEPGQAMRLAWKALISTIRPLQDPAAYEAGEKLVEYNIAYPQYARDGMRYRPHYPAYLATLRLAIAKHVESIYQLDPHEILQEALKPKTQP